MKDTASPGRWLYAPECPGYQTQACACSDRRSPCDYCSELEFYTNHPEHVEGLTFDQFRHDCHNPEWPTERLRFVLASEPAPVWQVLLLAVLASLAIAFGLNAWASFHAAPIPMDPGDPPALHDFDLDPTPSAAEL